MASARPDRPEITVDLPASESTCEYCEEGTCIMCSDVSVDELRERLADAWHREDVAKRQLAEERHQSKQYAEERNRAELALERVFRDRREADKVAAECMAAMPQLGRGARAAR